MLNPRASFDGEALAKAWLAVTVASGRNPDQSTIDQTVCIEWHEDGIRLIATDTWMIAWAWVPLDRSGIEPPGPGDKPEVVTIASDIPQRGAGLFAHVAKVTKGDKARPVDMLLAVEHVPRPDTLLAAMGEEQRVLTIELPGTERVILPCPSGEFPSWRKVMFIERQGMANSTLRLGAELLARTAKVAKIIGADTVDLRPTAEGLVEFEVWPEDDDLPPVQGVFAGNAIPAIQTADHEDEPDEGDHDDEAGPWPTTRPVGQGEP